MARLGRSQPFAPIIKRGLAGTSASGAGTITLNIAVAGIGAALAASVGTIGLNIAVAGIGQSMAASVGTIGIDIAVAGVGSASQAGAGVGTIGLNIALAGVGASSAAAVGAIGLNIDVAGIAPSLVIDAHDPGLLRKHLKDQEARRKKLFDDERAKREYRRAQVHAAYERIVEGKIDVPAAIAQDIKAAVETSNAAVPDKFDFGALAVSAAKVQALWDEYLERDDEEVLMLL